MKKFKNLMKRGLATFLSLTLVVSVMSISAFAKETDDAETDSNTTYTVEEITHNGVPVEGETFDAMKASLEDALNGDGQEDADGAAPAEGQPPADDIDDSQEPAEDVDEPEDGGENKDGEDTEEASQSTKLPVDLWIELQNHFNDNLTTGDEKEKMPEILVTYTYELDGKTVTGSYICNEENGSWTFVEEEGRWKFSYEIELPEGVTKVKFTQSNYDIDGYIIGSKGDKKDDVEHEFTFGTGVASMSIRDVYCLKSHADVDVVIGGVKDENGEEKEITTDEDGKLIVDYKPGDIIEYKVTVTNDGVDGILDMLLTVTLPEGLEFCNYGMAKVEGTSNNFKGVYDYNKTPEEQGVENDNYGGFAWFNYAIGAEWTYAPHAKGETTVEKGTYVLKIGAGYGTDPLAVVGDSITVTLLAKVIGEIASGDLELKAEGTTIVGVKDDATVTVYAPDAPEEPPVIVITRNPDPTPDPDPDPEDPVEIEDPETPLGEEPEDPVEIEEPEIPLGELPEIEIDEPDVPLGDVPQTGDISFMWYGAIVVSVMGLLGLSLLERKKRQED